MYGVPAMVPAVLLPEGDVAGWWSLWMMPATEVMAGEAADPEVLL